MKPKEGPLSPQELKNAEDHWIKESQKSFSDRLRKGEFKKFSPYTDSDSIVRVGGRVDKALISYETRHPALLPREHWISLLITRHIHQCGHTGVAATVAKTRRRFWILKAHDLAKTVKFRCVFCRELQAKAQSQVMAQLPECRLAPCTPPFYYTSCDYFGPYHVKVGRNKTTKYYGVIFTCLNTRAVHLELAVDCSTMEFIQVLRRFFSIRGQPSVIISDNGTQFVGAERELKEMISGWDTARILSRKGSTVEIHHSGISTSERMRRSVGEELQSCPKESCWRANIDTLRVIHVSFRSGESRQPTSNWPYTKRP